MSPRTRLVGRRPGPLHKVPLPPADAWSDDSPEADAVVNDEERVPVTGVVKVVHRHAPRTLEFAARIAVVLPSLPPEPSARQVYEALCDPRVRDVFYRCDETTIGMAMAALGYRPRQRTEGGRRLRRYERRQPAPAGTQPSSAHGITKETPELRDSNSRNAPKKGQAT